MIKELSKEQRELLKNNTEQIDESWFEDSDEYCGYTNEVLGLENEIIENELFVGLLLYDISCFIGKNRDGFLVIRTITIDSVYLFFEGEEFKLSKYDSDFIKNLIYKT